MLTFVAAWTKVRRLAGRDPPVLFLVLKKDNEQQIDDLLLFNHNYSATRKGREIHLPALRLSIHPATKPVTPSKAAHLKPELQQVEP